MSESTLPAVLITNDDGIDAPGIHALVSVLASANICRVFVCAPDSERSAVANAITIRDTLEAKLQEEYHGAALSYSLTGTPADCASLGLQGELFPKPALVLSGINKGGNTGLHCIYSGTVAGAREAHMAGVPAMAFSLDWGHGSSDALFEPAARACLPLVEAALKAVEEGSFPRDFFLNVNVPLRPAESKGVRLTEQGSTRVTIKWARVERRMGHQVAAGRVAGVGLPGMVPGGFALPGMVPRPGAPLGMAQLGTAVAARGAARTAAEEAAGGGEAEKQEPLHRMHWRHTVGAWELKDEPDSVDTVALGLGYTTISPLGLLTLCPRLDGVREQVSWLGDLLR